MAQVVVVEVNESFTHVAVKGKLDAAGVGAVELGLTAQTVARQKPALIDLNETELITSLGIGLLASIARSLHAHGLRVAVVVGPTPVRKVLEAMHMGPMIPLVEDREQGLRFLGVS